MKKTTIILLAILLTWSVELFAQVGSSQSPTNTVNFQSDEVKIGILKNVIKDITLQNTKDKILAFKSSDTTVVKYRTITFSNDSTTANITVICEGYGYANIEVTDSTDSNNIYTIYRKIVVGNDTTAIIALCDTITSLRKQLSSKGESGSLTQVTRGELGGGAIVDFFTELKKPKCIIFSILCVLVIVLGLLLFLVFAHYRKRNRHFKGNEQRGKNFSDCIDHLKNLSNEIPKLRNELNQMMQKSNASPDELDSLKKRNQELQNELNRMKQNQENANGQESSPATVQQQTKKYADSIVDGKFNKVSDQANEDTVFELFLKNTDDHIAEFTIYENAKRLVLKNPDFIDGCEKQKNNANSVDLQVEKGIVILLENGKWEITQKAKVKFV